MAKYTVRGQNKLRLVSDGRWQVWQVLVEVEGEEGIKAAELLQPPEEDFAAKFPAGSELPEGSTIEDSEYGLKLRLPRTGGGRGGGGGGGWKPRIDDDPAVFAARQAAIIHQHSQTVALELVKSQMKGDTDLRSAAAMTCELAGIFTEDVESVARTAELLRAQGRSDVPGNGQPSEAQPAADEVLT